MEKGIFREKSLEKIQSPESLNDYIRVSNPGVWLIVAATIILLVGACIWGIFGHVDTVVSAQAVVTNGVAVCEVSNVQNDPAKVRIGNSDCEIISTDHADGVCSILAKTDLPDGTYDAEVTVESIAPFSLIFQ